MAKITVLTDNAEEIATIDLVYDKYDGRGLSVNMDHVLDNLEVMILEAVIKESSLSEDDIDKLL